MSSLLPVIMSLMQPKKPKSEEKNGVKVKNDAHSSEKRAESSPEQAIVSKGCGNNNSENIEKEKEKTQRDVFAPVAFAGYEILSKLCALMKRSFGD